MRKAASFSRLSSAGRHEGSFRGLQSWHGFCRAPLSWDVLPCLVCQPPQAQAPFWSSAKQTNTNFVQAAFSGDTATLTTHQYHPNNLDFNPDRDHANRECSDSSAPQPSKPSWALA